MIDNNNELIANHVFQAEFTANDYAVTKCDMPREQTVITIYVISGIAFVAISLYIITFECCRRKIIRTKKST